MTEQTYTIKAVANRTGLSTHVIRAWEKRYGAIEPKRSDSNRRLYSEDEVRRLQLLRQAVEVGHSIGNIANLPTVQLMQLTGSREAPAMPAPGAYAATDGADILSSCMHATQQLNAHELESLLVRASVSLSRPVLIDTIIVPLIHRIGDAWRDGSLRIVHEHLATSVIRSFLGNMRSGYEIPAFAPKIVVTTPAGQLHELGALIVAVTAAAEGWHVIYLGPNLPAEEIGAAVAGSQANALALSTVYPAADPRVTEELSKIARYLPAKTKILVGGRAAPTYSQILNQIGAHIITELSQLRQILENFQA